MAVSQIQICNLALTRVGADRISSITQETKSARTLNAIYELCRDEVLRARRWNFATTRAELSPTGTEPLFDWDYAYDLPSDCLRVLEPNLTDIEHVVESGQILADESELSITYIYRNDDENSWDSSFCNAFAWKLAAEIAYTLTQSLSLKESCEKSYERALREASTLDGMEGTLPDLEVSDWTNSRR